MAPGKQDRVEYFELLFDLVYVFTLIQITTTMVTDGTLTGIVHGTVVLLLVWWVWVAFTALANMGVPADSSRDWRPLIFAVAMGLILLMALAVPEAFWKDSRLFAFSFLVLGILAMVGQLWAGRDEPENVPALRRGWLVAMILPAVVVASCYVTSTALSVVLVTVGLVAAVIAPFAFGTADWRLSAEHLAERYALFIIITFGESILAIGQGAAKAGLSPLLIACSLIALILIIALWQQYRTRVLDAGEQALHRLAGTHLTRFVRLGYAILHLLMVWGIILMAVGIKSALADLTTPLDDILEASLVLGVLAFLGAVLVFLRLSGGRIRPIEAIQVVVLSALVVLGPRMPTATLLVVTAIVVLLGVDPRTIGRRSPHAVDASD